MIEGETFLILLSSASDPLNFDPDPLPGIVYPNSHLVFLIFSVKDITVEALKHWVGYVT